MAEENQSQQPEQAQQPQQPAGPVFQLERCYLKDASLEMPHAPEVLFQAPEEAPKVDIQFECSQQGLPVPGRIEVTVRGTITVTVKDKTLFLVEGKQAGIFVMTGFPAEQAEHILNVLCPSIIYPYLRANLADIVTRTGMPPVNLPEMNFEALYRQRVAEAQKKAAEAAAAPQEGAHA